MKNQIAFDDKQKTFVLIIIVVAVAFVIYLNFLLRPQIIRVAVSFRNMHREATNFRRMQDDIAKVPKYKADIAAYEEKVNRYEKMLPAEQEIPALLQNLSGMAKTSGVKIVGITPVLAKEESGQRDQAYQEIPILINAKSGYHELGNFIDKLENADRFMKVADISIKSDTATPKKHDVELLILTYILLNSSAR